MGVGTVLYFLLGAAVGFVLQRLVWRLVANASAALRAIQPRGSIVRHLTAIPASLALIVVLLSFLVWIADRSLVESATNIRLAFGAVFGWLIGLLTSETGEPSPILKPGAMVGLSDHGPADISPGSEPASKGPWWVRPSSLIVIGVIVLPLFAAIAPNGELDLSFLRSVKTPFLEAQFAQNEVELRLDLKSEPQGLFKLTERGLAEALYMAYYEFIYQRPRDNSAYSPEKVASPADALRFITDVLQPAALCAHEIDRVYDDQDVLVDALRIIGTGLGRALELSKNALEPNKQNGEETDVNKSIKATLELSFGKFFENATILLDQLSSNGICQDLTPHSITRLLNNYPAEGNSSPTIVALFRNPAVVHAASMFSLWSGSPGAVLKLLENFETIGKKLQEQGRPSLMAYPPILYIRGFANRWQENVGYEDYLRDWDNAIDHLGTRLSQIKPNLSQINSKTPAAFENCRDRPFVLTYKYFCPTNIFTTTQDGNQKSNNKSDNDVQLLYGYYTYWLQKIRSHRIYETAREILANKYSQNGDSEIEHALRYAKEAKKFVEADGLRIGNGCTLQQLTVSVEQETSSDGNKYSEVTTTNPDQEYASAVDGYGLLMLAKAFRTDGGDKELLESAIAHFDDALGYKPAGSSDKFWDTIRDHRMTARRALGLPSR